MGNTIASNVCCQDNLEERQAPVILLTSPFRKSDSKEEFINLEPCKSELGATYTDAKEEELPAKEYATLDEPKPSILPAEAATDTCEFTIKLKRSSVSERWGLGMKKTWLKKTLTEQQLLIIQPGGKCLEDWETANPAQTVKALDEMIQVNGVTGIGNILEMLQTTLEAEIILRRQVRINVQVIKGTGENLAAMLKTGTVHVANIVDGPIGTHNNACFLRTHQIAVGDKLVGINGRTMEAKQLLEELDIVRDGDDVTLTFERCDISLREVSQTSENGKASMASRMAAAKRAALSR